MKTVSGATMEKTGTTDSCFARSRRDCTDYHTTGGRQQYARAATNVWHARAKGSWDTVALHSQESGLEEKSNMEHTEV